jgi:hypothetical protein
MKAASLLLAFSLLLVQPRARSQDTTGVNPTRLAIVGAVTLGTVTAIHFYQRDAWWLGPRSGFWFVNDWHVARNVDKLGHMYGAYLASNAFDYALRWTGVDRERSLVCGAMLALAFELYVETEDGFHQGYGFSPGDAMADIVGAMIPLAQTTFPVLENFRLKWSYFPSESYRDELAAGQRRAFIDDYEGQTYWLAMDPHFISGDGFLKVVPAWLGLAVGAGVKNLNPSHGGGDLIVYVSLDYNLRRIETGSSFLRGLFSVLDFIHLPAPGISVEHGRVRFGVFY